MYSLNIDTPQYNNYNTVKSVGVSHVSKPIAQTSVPAFTAGNPQMTQVPYNKALTASRLRTELSSSDEKEK